MKTEENNLKTQQGQLDIPVVSGSFSKEDLENAYIAGFAKHCELINEGMYDAHWVWAKNGFDVWLKNYEKTARKPTNFSRGSRSTLTV